MKKLFLPVIFFSIVSSANALITEKKANELIEKEKNKIKNEITQKFQEEKSRLESDLAIAKAEQQTSAEALKLSQEDNQRLQEEISNKEKIINDNNQRIRELQSQAGEINSIRNQLEQKTIQFNNLTRASSEEFSRIITEKDKKIRALEDRNTALQTQSQQQISNVNSKTAEEINRIRNEMEQKSRELDEQKRMLQNQTQQQMYDLSNRNSAEINRIRSECEQKVKELEIQKNSQADTIKSQEETIKTQNLKIDELIAGGSTYLPSVTPTTNASSTLTLLDCSQFANRASIMSENGSNGVVPVKELSEIDLRKTENRCLNEMSVLQQRVQQNLVDVVVNQQKVIDEQKNNNIVWSQVNAEDLELEDTSK